MLIGDYGGRTLRVIAPLTVRAKTGEPLELFLDKSKVHLFDAETQGAPVSRRTPAERMRIDTGSAGISRRPHSKARYEDNVKKGKAQ